MKILGGLLIGYLNACTYNVQDQFDDLVLEVDDLAAQLKALKLRADSVENSLVNNNLLTQCTVQGSTDQWLEPESYGHHYEEGSFFVQGKKNFF